tara:strand:- start:1032 stop:3164 length:2133 start_codon:yes stop_codon:yes gene_type:complete
MQAKQINDSKINVARVLALGGIFASGTAFSEEVPAMDPVQFEEVVISASGFEQDITHAPASISVVSRQDLEEKRVNSLAEALSEVEGVDVSSSAGKTGGREISIRGMPSDYTLILVDGRRQNVAGNVTPNGFGSTSTSFLPPVSSIERIEVIRGPMSTLYGSDAMGGVVNIITRKVNSEWGGSLTTGGTIQGDSDFGNTSTSNFYFSGPLIEETLGLTLRGSYYKRFESDLEYTDDAGDPVEVSKRGPSPVEADIYTLGGRLTYMLNEDHDLWFDADIARQSYDNSEAQLGTLGVRGYEDELQFNREQYTLAHTWRYDQGQLDSSLMHNATETIGRVLPAGTANVGGPRELENTNIVFDTKAVYNLGSHRATLGGQWWDAEMIDGVADAPYEHTQWALFLEDEWHILPDLALTFGARYDDHNVFGSQVSPRAYAVWSVTDQWTVKGGISYGYKAPRLDQLADGITGYRGQGTIPLIGTPTLTPETSVTHEVGVVYDNLDWVRVSVTVFHNQFDDKIANGPGLLNCSWAGDPNRPGCVDYGNWPNVDEFRQTVNVDEAMSQGLELSTTIQFAEDWTLTANYTYTDSEQQSGDSKGDPLYDTPEHMVNARLRWNTTDKLSLWLSGEYRGERFRSEGEAKDALGDYKAYVLFHLGGVYQLSENVTLNATINNLLDKDFVDYQAYDDGGSTSYSNVYSNNEEPRRLWLSATYTF